MVEEARVRSAGFGGTEAFLAGSSHTDTHSRCPWRGQNCEGEARGPGARSGGSEKKKIFIK